MGTVLVWEDEKALEMDGGDSSTIMWMYLLPLDFTFRNGQNGKFQFMHILTIKNLN